MTTTLNGTGVVFNDTTVQTTAARGGGTTTTGSADVTLTVSSNQSQLISMTAAGKSVILPDATTMSKTNNTFVIQNIGPAAFTIKDNSGFTLFSPVNYEAQITCTLVDTSTAGGKWAVTNNTPYVGLPGPVNVSGSITLAGSLTVRPVTLSSTQSLIAYQVGANSVSLVLATVSGTSVTFGSPVSVFTTTYNGAGISLIGLSSTSAALFSTNGSNVIFGWAISISGSTITVGAATTTSVTAGNGYVVAADTSSTGLIVSGNGTGVSALGFSVSGTTMGYGAASTNFITNTNGPQYAIARYAANSFVTLTMDFTATTVKHRALTLSGTTITLGTTTTTEANGSTLVGSMLGLRSITTGGSGWATFGGGATTGVVDTLTSLQYSGTTYTAGSFIQQSVVTAGSFGGRYAIFNASNYAVSVYPDDNGFQASYVVTVAPYAGGATLSFTLSAAVTKGFYGVNGATTALDTTAGTVLYTNCQSTTNGGTYYLTAQVYKMLY